MNLYMKDIYITELGFHKHFAYSLLQKGTHAGFNRQNKNGKSLRKYI